MPLRVSIWNEPSLPLGGAILRNGVQYVAFDRALSFPQKPGPVPVKIFLPTAADCQLVTIHDTSINAFRKHNTNRGVSWVLEPRAADIIVLFEEWGTRFWHYSDI